MYYKAIKLVVQFGCCFSVCVCLCALNVYSSFPTPVHIRRKISLISILYLFDSFWKGINLFMLIQSSKSHYHQNSEWETHTHNVTSWKPRLLLFCYVTTNILHLFLLLLLLLARSISMKPYHDKIQNRKKIAVMEMSISIIKNKAKA